jgi:hypothetical protein
VRVPSLTALLASSNTTLYLYYGNPAAASTSDGPTVFDFFDGFESPFSDRPLSNAATWQITLTYDGSGQVVHPDIAYFPDAWHGYKYWVEYHTSDFCAARDMLDNGHCGALCVKDSVDDLARTLTRACGDSGLMEGYGREFQQCVLRQFNWDRAITEGQA